MRIACGITTYFPNNSEVSNINNLVGLFDKVIVYDNTEVIETVESNQFSLLNDEIDVISNNVNEGLSVALNSLCNRAISLNFDFICLLDQDSVFPKESVLKAIDHIKNFSADKVGIYAPKVHYVLSSYSDFFDNQECKEEVVKWAITSGSFVNLKAFLDVGGFDEYYFIDRLDRDYCLSLTCWNYKLIQMVDVKLYQQLGVRRKKFLFVMNQHTPLRHYYIFRNRMYYYVRRDVKWSSYPLLLGTSLLHFISVLFEHNSVSKWSMMVKGYRDYRRGVSGRCPYENI